VAPIQLGDATLGALAVALRAPAHANDPVLVRIIARELGGALRMATLVEESRWLATTDSLTGLMNRRAFLDWIKREALRSSRYQDNLSVILLDVDHFKLINDRRGHAAGDSVLMTVGRLLAKSVRSCDVVGRWGGEEFVVAMPCTGLEGALTVADRLRQAVEEHEVTDPRGQRVAVTASFGVAELAAGETVEQVVDRADRAMYAAKSAGRNRVCGATGTAVAPLATAGPIPIEA
jgi:two-component system cell cycle response regulator